MNPIRRSVAQFSCSLWSELHRELRRHAGDERLPLDLRSRLREGARRSLARSARAREAKAFERRLLRDRVETSPPPALLYEGATAAAALGITSERPIVAIDVRRRPDTCLDAIAWLARQGYCVVRIGEASEPIRRPDVVDVSTSSERSQPLELFILCASRFLVCESRERQHTACTTNTPSLLLNVADPFSGYPVRKDSLFTVGTPIDLDTGRTLSTREMLDESYFRNLRNTGIRSNDASTVFAAIQEMHEGVTLGWREHESQTRFRDLVVENGSLLADRVPFVAEWGPDAGFIGDGRLARYQAATIFPDV